MRPRIYKIIITTPQNNLQLWGFYNVAPTPIHHKATNQNGRYGVWIFGDRNEVVFVPFLAFLVVEYRFKPQRETYGYVARNNITGGAFWDDINRVYYIKMRKEYLNLE